MGSSASPPVPSIQSLLTAQNAQAQDLVATKQALSGQDSLLSQVFGGGSGVLGQRGASQAGTLNGLSSVALTPLGAK